MQISVASTVPFQDDEPVGLSEAGTQFLRAENIKLAAQLILTDIDHGLCALISAAEWENLDSIPVQKMGPLFEIVRCGKLLLAGIAEA